MQLLIERVWYSEPLLNNNDTRKTQEIAEARKQKEQETPDESEEVKRTLKQM